MKYLMMIAALCALMALTGCKEPECMHVHMGGAMIEMCSPNVKCEGGKDEDGTSMRICQYVRPAEEAKANEEK